ncbi:hypothetical protein EJB05_25984, partial [Eragrostis curvula]
MPQPRRFRPAGMAAWPPELAVRRRDRVVAAPNPRRAHVVARDSDGQKATATCLRLERQVKIVGGMVRPPEGHCSSAAGVMADPVASVEKIVKIGLKIKEAVDTVRQNEEVCLEIRKSVLRYSTMLSQLQQRGVMNNSSVMSGALEDLAETLERALKLDTIVAKTSFDRDSTDDARSEFYGEGNNILPGSEPPSVPSVELKNFSLSELKSAIAFENIIGIGGSCQAFRAVLNDGNVVAVKMFPEETDNFPMPIIDHVINLQHKNIVKVLGCCYEYKHQPYVVRLLKRNSAVIEKIYWVEEWSQLEWSSVFRIIEGVAQAVHYMHEQHIVHMDVKPGNILLDSDMNPKITDFNLSLVLDADVYTAGISGTFQYMPPEYVMRGIISTSNDVYAFGVTLFKTAWEVWQSGEIEELFIPSLFDSSQLMEIKRFMCIGLLCTQRDRAYRPTMKDVIEMLNGDEELPTPKTPAFYSKQGEGPEGSYASSDGSASP